MMLGMGPDSWLTEHIVDWAQDSKVHACDWAPFPSVEAGMVGVHWGKHTEKKMGFGMTFSSNFHKLVTPWTQYSYVDYLTYNPKSLMD